MAKSNPDLMRLVEGTVVTQVRVLSAVCCLLSAGCWLLAAGCWLLAAVSWLLAAGCWLLATFYHTLRRINSI
jgi:hypothetical protein